MRRLDEMIWRYGPELVLTRASGLAYSGYVLVTALALMDLVAARPLGVVMVGALGAQVTACRAAVLLSGAR